MTQAVEDFFVYLELKFQFIQICLNVFMETAH